MNPVYPHLVRLRVPIILITAAVTVWLGLHIPDVRFDSSARGLIPEGDEALTFIREVTDTFGNDLVSLAVVVAPGPEGVFAGSTLAKIDSLTRAIRAIRGVSEVVSLTNALYLKGTGGLLETVPVVPEPPSTPEEARALRAEVLANELFHKTLVSPDGRAAAINIFLGTMTDSQLVALDIDGKVHRLLDAAAGPEEVYYAGLSDTRRIIIRTMGREIARLAPICLVVVAIVLAVGLRSTLGVVLPLLSVSIATIWTIGLIGLTGRPLSPTSTLLPPLLIAVGNAYAIHLVAGFREAFARCGDGREAVLATLRSVGGPVMTTAFTTMVGFSALMVNDIPNIRTLGLFTTIGVLFCAVVSLTTVPAILSYSRTPARSDRPPATHPAVEALLAFAERLAACRGRAILVVTAIVAAVAVAGLTRIKIDTNFLSYFKPDTEIRVTADLIAKNLTGVSTFYLIINGPEQDSMKRPDVLHAVDDIQRFIESEPGIDKTASIVDHLKLLHMALNDDDPAFKRIPETQGIIDEELLVFQISQDPAKLERYVTGDFSQMSVFVRTSLIGSEELRQTLDRIQEFADGRLPGGVTARPTGSAVVLNHALESIALGQRNSLAIALIVVFALMTYLFRSVRAALIAMIPNVLPIVVLFGAMGWSGITLNTGTAVIGAMAVGIAVDDTIHYMVGVRRGLRSGGDQRRVALDTLREVGRPILFTTLTLSLGFLVLLLSDFQTISSVGILTTVTMVTAVLADLLVLPAVLLAVPAIGGGGRPQRP